jgi:carotenoid cleavage dioxygenase-like enzyme
VIASVGNLDDCFLPFVGGMPYVHSFGLTETRALILINPVRLPVFYITGLIRERFLRASTESDKTFLWVVELATGQSEVVEVPEPIFFFHAISATDHSDGTYSSLRLVAKSDSSLLIGENQFLRMDQVVTPIGRNQAAKQGTVVEIRTDGKSEATVQWFTLDKIVGFDLPTHRYSRVFNGDGPWKSFRHPRFVYGVASFCGSDYFDQWCIVKVDTMGTTPTGRTPTLIHREYSHYSSEPIFVADPDGSMEDDGVLLSHVYDGVQRESFLLVLNAQTLQPMPRRTLVLEILSIFMELSFDQLVVHSNNCSS